MSQNQTFYLTTAIAYTSRKPHIGNTYEVVLSDAIIRFKRLLGYDTYFLTGTDEHGQKIEQNAKEMGVTPQQYVDEMAATIQSMWDLMHCDYNQFIRTTDSKHQKTVQKIFRRLYEKGDIYLGTYEGLYCTPCESFWTENQLVEEACPDCGREVSLTKEPAYFFRMSQYQDQLIAYIEQNPQFIQPESRKKEMINNFLKPGLQDLCVSRSSFSWGIPVDFDSKHIVYVWLDALTNYITALGYTPDESSELFQKYWPCDVHVIGKDILRFHAIYWPILLMALELPLPKQIFGHPWLLSGEDKMSKSRGNVIYADHLVHLFGVDAVRYYLLKEMPYAQDGTMSYEHFIIRYNADLANTLGNLVNRTVSMSHKYFEGFICNTQVVETLEVSLQQGVLHGVKQYTKLMHQYKTAEALEVVMNIARRCNKYIDETMPWTLIKQPDSHKKLQTILYNLLESIRFLAVMLGPIMPDSSVKILKQLGISSCQDDTSLSEFGYLRDGQVGLAEPLFARLDEKEILEKIKQTEQETCSTNPRMSQSNPEEQPQPNQQKITIEDFQRVELMTAKILDCTKVKKSDKLLCFILDDGSGKPRQVLSGIAQWYQPDQLIGKTVMLVENLKPIKLRGMDSNGMILSSDLPDGSVQLLMLGEHMPPGMKIR